MNLILKPRERIRAGAGNAFFPTVNNSYLLQTSTLNYNNCIPPDNNKVIPTELFQTDNNLIIYPNPSKNFVKVYLNNNQEMLQIQIIDLSGYIIWHSSNPILVETINVTDWCSGIYVISVTSETKIWNKRFVVF